MNLDAETETQNTEETEGATEEKEGENKGKQEEEPTDTLAEEEKGPSEENKSEEVESEEEEVTVDEVTLQTQAVCEFPLWQLGFDCPIYVSPSTLKFSLLLWLLPFGSVHGFYF